MIFVHRLTVVAAAVFAWWMLANGSILARWSYDTEDASMMFLPGSPLPLGRAGKELTAAMVRQRLRDLIDLTVEGQPPMDLILELRYLADIIDTSYRTPFNDRVLE